MQRMFPLINPKLPRFLYGGDYNPEQWPREVWDEDITLMKLAHVNVATVGVFSWVTIQPSPDRFEFDWLDEVMDKLAENDIYACLATPTAAQPAWLSQMYPEVLRVDETGMRRHHSGRVNFCPNSRVFRKACADMATRLAKQYKKHKALLLWHVGNEYSGECYCDHCAEAFRQWLKALYGSLDELNQKWYTAFWSHTYTDWSQIEPPYRNGERSINAQVTDYRRFCSDSLLECFLNEARVLRKITPGVPVTTNMMGTYYGVDYTKWAPHLDVIAWDSYPSARSDIAEPAFSHDVMYGLKRRPFLLMEQTPSTQNWQEVNALKRPGQLALWSWAAVAHGSDSVMYFQWRRSRGGPEKLHGAVVDHVGHENTRVFEEVTELGAQLAKLGDQIIGSGVEARVALVFDWENWWTLDQTSGPVRQKKYRETVFAHYRALWERNIPVHVVSTEADLAGYDVIIAPMLYSLRRDWAENVAEFVRRGGRLITTALTGWVDEYDLAHLGGYPGPLREALGIWIEEADALFEDQHNRILIKRSFGPCRGEYKCTRICEIVHAETATVLATYGEDFYAGWPVITENQYGKGYAYHIATVPEGEFLEHFYRTVCADCGVLPVLQSRPGVEVRRRSQRGGSFIFVLNHNDEVSYVELGDTSYVDLLTGKTHTGSLPLRGYDVRVLREVPTEAPAEAKAPAKPAAAEPSEEPTLEDLLSEKRPEPEPAPVPAEAEEEREGAEEAEEAPTPEPARAQAAEAAEGNEEGAEALGNDESAVEMLIEEELLEEEAGENDLDDEGDEDE